MALSTKEKEAADTSGDDLYDKKERIAQMKEYHAELFNQEGVENPMFIPKLAYVPKGKTEQHLAFFLSEMQFRGDTYIEFASSSYIPEDPQRRLWKLSYNPHFEEEYDKTEPHSISGHRRYLVPVGELIEIKAKYAEQAKLFETSTVGTDVTDEPMKEMTIRDYMAIHMRVPCSTKSYINEIITKHKEE